jgi:citrate synthase
MSTHTSPSRIRTQMATLTVDTITVRGHNLVDKLIGKIDVADLFFLEVTGKLPKPSESKLINAMIVAIAEHGMMPSVIAARLTLLGAPESFQGAVASGLLGAGDTFVGPTSNVAKMLQVEAAAFTGDVEAKAKQVVESYAAAKRRLTRTRPAAPSGRSSCRKTLRDAERARSRDRQHRIDARYPPVGLRTAGAPAHAKRRSCHRRDLLRHRT